MALYTYKCPKCNHRKEVIKSMKDLQGESCCNCGISMNRDFQTDLVNAGNKNYRKAIHSDALAISPTQRDEHERLFPDIKIDEACRPVFDSFQEHEAYIKKCGIIKHPQKIKRSGAIRIA